MCNRRYKKLPTKVLYDLCDQFRKEIVPLCIENNFSLHQAFDYTRRHDEHKHKILSQLWSTYFGKEYLRSCFRGGRISKVTVRELRIDTPYEKT